VLQCFAPPSSPLARQVGTGLRHLRYINRLLRELRSRPKRLVRSLCVVRKPKGCLRTTLAATSVIDPIVGWFGSSTSRPAPSAAGLLATTTRLSSLRSDRLTLRTIRSARGLEALAATTESRTGRRTCPNHALRSCIRKHINPDSRPSKCFLYGDSSNYEAVPALADKYGFIPETQVRSERAPFYRRQAMLVPMSLET
jgi:hypothetical protein